jgi:hypothetical protein
MQPSGSITAHFTTDEVDELRHALRLARSQMIAVLSRNSGWMDREGIDLCRRRARIEDLLSRLHSDEDQQP